MRLEDCRDEAKVPRMSQQTLMSTEKAVKADAIVTYQAYHAWWQQVAFSTSASADSYHWKQVRDVRDIHHCSMQIQEPASTAIEAFFIIASH